MRATMPKVSQNVLDSFLNSFSNREEIPFDEFVNWSLYDPQIGYYQSSKKRVGKGSENDFYTSSTIGTLWGKLIIESSKSLLKGKNPHEYVFVEIGAEPGESILEGLEHPFAGNKTIRLGDLMNIPDHAIVYSNEWLDARPFKRFKYSRKENCWFEIFVCLENSYFKQIERISNDNIISSFPKEASHGYLIDWPSGSISSLNELLSENTWKGLFLTFDYGLDIQTIFHERPEGTARAYLNQTMATDLLDSPGNQDLTCHICWDSLKLCLQDKGFHDIGISSQESFLIKHASEHMQRIFEQNGNHINKEMLELRELIHPAHLGHGLQALHGARF
jgi:SAM-dependent MidA family methyltransferase